MSLWRCKYGNNRKISQTQIAATASNLCDYELQMLSIKMNSCLMWICPWLLQVVEKRPSSTPSWVRGWRTQSPGRAARVASSRARVITATRRGRHMSPLPCQACATGNGGAAPTISATASSSPASSWMSAKGAAICGRRWTFTTTRLDERWVH